MFVKNTVLVASMVFTSSLYAAPYISLAIGQGDGAEWTSAINPAETLGNVSKADKETAFTASVGNFFGNVLGAEVNYTNLGKYKAEGVEGDLKAIGVSAIAQLNLGTFILYGKAGMAYIDAKSTTTLENVDPANPQDVVKDELAKVKPNYGAGMEYMFSPSVGAFSEYQVFNVEAKNAETSETVDSKVKITSAGIRIRF